MIVIKPKMLKGELNIDKNMLVSVGAILGALGSKVQINTSIGFKFNIEQKYLLELLEESGCTVSLTNDTLSVIPGGLTKALSVDAYKYKQEIFLIIVYLCFLKGSSSLFNINKLDSAVKDKIFMLIGNLKMIGAEITVDNNEVLFCGKQTLNAFELSAYSSLEIFTALCIAAHRCEGGLTIKNISGIDDSEYDDLMNMLFSLGAEISEKETKVKTLCYKKLVEEK